MTRIGGTLLSAWRVLPVAIRAVLVGTAVAASGTVPWALLTLANQKVLLAVPWAVGPMALYLWFWMRYLNGAGWPSATAAARRESLRASLPPGDTLGTAVFAGMLGLMTMVPLAGVLGRLVRLPAESQPIHTPAGMPFATVMLLLLMASIVAGVVEEAAFRGYMQSPIERRHGPAAAILGTGVVFGLGHFTHHPAAVVAMLPYYMAAAAVYGGLAWLTNSIWPGVVVHALGDMFSLGRLWITGKPEWEMSTSTSATPAPLVWDGGADATFWSNLTALIMLGGFAVAAYVALASVTRAERSTRTPTSSS